MKKKLIELNLEMPQIPLLETRSLMGGYSGEGGGDYAFEHEIPEVTVYPPSDGGYYDHINNGHDRDEGMQDDQQDDHPLDPDEGRDGTIPDVNERVRVADGDCVLGALAAAIQSATGCTAEEALAKAMEIFEKAGIDLDSSSKGGITLDGISLIDVINSFLEGFSATSGEGWTGIDVLAHFDNGGKAIGYLQALVPVLDENGNQKQDEYGNDATEFKGHMLEVTGFDRNTLEYETYDPTTGGPRNFKMGEIEVTFITRD